MRVVVLASADGRGLQFAAVPGAVPEGGRPLGGLGWQAVLLAVLGAIAGGVLLNLMPCVFPILALKALHLTRAGGDPGEARSDALAYTAGTIIGTGALGALLLAIRAVVSAGVTCAAIQMSSTPTTLTSTPTRTSRSVRRRTTPSAI